MAATKKKTSKKTSPDKKKTGFYPKIKSTKKNGIGVYP